MKNMYKKNSGITLIALVVIIIVLLILSGISVGVLVGDNGILNKSIQAKDLTDKSQIKEEVMEKWYRVEKNAIQNNYSDDRKLDEFRQMLINEDSDATVNLEDNKIKVKYKEQNINIPKT